MTLTEQPKVTLIVGPRERFSYARQSLESIYADTEYPFDLVYVDVCSPKPIRQYLEQQAVEKSFKLLHTDYYISPNQSRNVGLRYVLNNMDSKYVVFIENDVVVKRGWLTRAVESAEKTGAAVVGPLTCIGQPEHQVIHNAGGRSYIEEQEKNGKIKRRIRQKAFLTGRAIADVPEEMGLVQCDYVEFHCMLARTAIFIQTGLLDEGMLATREHIDFCFMVTEAGGKIYSDRQSIVTSDTLGIASNKTGLEAWFGKVQLPDFKWSDMSYFMLRWNHEWDKGSLDHLRQKWNLAEDKYFKKRYKGLGSRRRELLIEPLVDRLTFGRGNPWLEEKLIAIEKRINSYLYQRYLKKRERILQQKGADVASLETESLRAVSNNSVLTS
ncbi:putative Glycosyl transferase, group 2 family protein [Hyella patelloides LEGE 07179]|uniref:Putative Glycosyl transferase, group 2 family protein n=1 Tax=Hyella patelloides LEGE 07179 TaxID=945734 RepID=A0A563VJ84_9CYAN|nr:glycosyltransferase [Hyella patelloides]VEP11472.1 putative Glycosyl transferase, group 2 family protein [Hyella patelloides LEGE 07179]